MAPVTKIIEAVVPKQELDIQRKLLRNPLLGAKLMKNYANYNRMLVQRGKTTFKGDVLMQNYRLIGKFHFSSNFENFRRLPS